MTNEHSDAKKIFRYLYIAFTLVIIAAALILIINSTLDAPRPTRVGAVFSGSVDEPGWNGANYAGINAACKSLRLDLTICESVPEEHDACFEAAAKLAEDKCEAVLLTSYGYARYADELASMYPNIRFFVNGSDSVHTDAIYYFGRMYEMRYLSGMIAGMMTKTGTVGYVAAMPNNEVNRGINAFALGVRRVNPDAVIRVIFTGAWDDAEKETAAVSKLISGSADIITYQQNRETVPAACDAAGVDFIGMYDLTGEYSEHLLTSIECRWSKIYTYLLRNIHSSRVSATKVCWLGAQDGAVHLARYSEKVPADVTDLIYAAEDELKAGKNVFAGEIYDNTGTLRCGADEVISDSSLLYGMDWYAEGVVTDEAE